MYISKIGFVPDCSSSKFAANMLSKIKKRLGHLEYSDKFKELYLGCCNVLQPIIDSDGILQLSDKEKQDVTNLVQSIAKKNLQDAQDAMKQTTGILERYIPEISPYYIGFQLGQHPLSASKEVRAIALGGNLYRVNFSTAISETQQAQFIKECYQILQESDLYCAPLTEMSFAKLSGEAAFRHECHTCVASVVVRAHPAIRPSLQTYLMFDAFKSLPENILQEGEFKQKLIDSLDFQEGEAFLYFPFMTKFMRAFIGCECFIQCGEQWLEFFSFSNSADGQDEILNGIRTYMKNYEVDYDAETDRYFFKLVREPEYVREFKEMDIVSIFKALSLEEEYAAS